MSNMTAWSDEELVCCAQKGEVAAFNELFDRYFPKVYARVKFKVPLDEVDDITQEVFITMMKSLHSFQGKSRFKTWLWTLVSRKIVDFYRSRNVLYTYDETGESIEIATSKFQDSIRGRDDLTIVRAAIAKLPPLYQEILFLRFIDEVPFHEIASLKGQSLEATKSLFRRSVAALRKEIVSLND
jgi:RNA polymerase sigma-70 factor, ECF subfamily